MTEGSMKKWLDSGEYLPSFLRDFHDAKDFFKTLHSTVKVEGDYIKDINWVSGQCYVIDIFLWWAAKHGYTLQASRKKGIEFQDINESIEKIKERERNVFREYLEQSRKEREAAINSNYEI